jgi:hypothetical protein
MIVTRRPCLIPHWSELWSFFFLKNPLVHEAGVGFFFSPEKVLSS